MYKSGGDERPQMAFWPGRKIRPAKGVGAWTNGLFYVNIMEANKVARGPIAAGL